MMLHVLDLEYGCINFYRRRLQFCHLGHHHWLERPLAARCWLWHCDGLFYHDPFSLIDEGHHCGSEDARSEKVHGPPRMRSATPAHVDWSLVSDQLCCWCRSVVGVRTRGVVWIFCYRIILNEFIGRKRVFPHFSHELPQHTFTLEKTRN